MDFRSAKTRHIRLGAFGEKAAGKMLRSKGMEILLTNHRNRGGELDIIALDGTTICFVEVKTRRVGSKSAPGENLSPAQMKRMERAAAIYLEEIGSPKLPHRFDLVEVLANLWDVKSIRHWTNIATTRKTHGKKR
jgi:putative endonuclease